MKNRMRAILDPVVTALARAGITPLGVTAGGLVVSLAGAVFIARGSLRIGALILLAGSLFDVLDGSLARRIGAESAFGAFIDSTIDRVTELAFFGALVIHFARAAGLENAGAQTAPRMLAAGDVRLLLLLAALGGSFLTSYTRARAEGLGLECRVGILERPERIAILFIGLLAGGAVLDAGIAVLAVLTTVTAVQRIVHVRRLTARRRPGC